MTEEVFQYAESEYIYQGQKFAEYIDVDSLKNKTKEMFGITGDDKRNLPEMYEDAFKKSETFLNKFSSVVFENIFYSHLKHIYINQFFSSQEEENYKKNLDKLIRKFNYNTEGISQNLKLLMSSNGFALMDRLNITTSNSRFIAAIQHERKEKEIVNTKILFVETVYAKSKIEYFIAGVEIDFLNKIYSIKIKNKDIDKENIAENSHTINKLYKLVKKEVVMPLLLNTERIDVESDREGMYQLCKELDESLLKEIREKVINKTESVKYFV